MVTFSMIYLAEVVGGYTKSCGCLKVENGKKQAAEYFRLPEVREKALTE